MEWLWWAIGIWLAIGVGCARWSANLLRVEPWRGRLTTLLDGLAEAMVPPKLILGGMMVFLTIIGPLAWPWLWWKSRHDDGRPL